MAEPDAARSYNVGPGANLNIDTETAQKSISDMAAAMKGLQQALSDFGNNAYNIADKINRHLKSIGDTATKVTQQLSGMGSAVSGIGGGTSSGGTTSAAAAAAGRGSGGGVGGGSSSSWVSEAASSIARVTSDKDLIPGVSLGDFLGTGTTQGVAGLAKDAVLAPIRYLRSRINTNRDTALMASGGLNMQALQQGTGTAGLMTSLSKFPGNIYGTPSDLIDLFGNAPALGASLGFGDTGAIGKGGPGQGVRAKGFFTGIQEMQQMNPMAQVGGQGGLAAQLGSYSADTSAQQRAMMFTGGAMGMITTGGHQKSLSEWAESITRWFEGLRPGSKRGKPFAYGDLMAQYFPGSNIDAWFNINAVPQNMRDYWWTYALGKAKAVAAGTEFKIGGEDQGNNVAYQRLKSSSELTRTEFGLAGQMAPQYAQREASNRWFNELMGQIQQKVIPALSNSALGSMIQYLPDSIESLLMTGLERGAGAFFGGDVPNAAGDIGDVGGYGAMGGTGVAGLHPDMKSKVGRMMRANPRLRINSGLRDTGLQERLRAGGNRNVSGKPSAHTRGMAADIGPASQYGWLVKNAKRFGLASGVGHGEPWHVGMKGDVPGVGDPPVLGGDFGGAVTDQGTKQDAEGNLSGFLNMLKGGNTAEGMASLISKILDVLLGGLGKLTGGGKAPSNGFGSNADDLFNRLVSGTKPLTLGGSKGLTPGGSLGAPIPGTGGYSVAPGTDTAVQAAHAAGFTGEALVKMVAIAGRESSYNPLAHRTSTGRQEDWTTGDRGLWQINYVNDSRLRNAGIIRDANDLKNPLTNARAAFLISTGGTNLSGWSSGPNGWEAGGDPLYGTNVPGARAAVQQAGYGDVQSAFYPATMPTTPQSRQQTVFNNTFQINGGVGGYGGGSNGGIDVKRTVTLLADQLEAEMKRRMARAA